MTRRFDWIGPIVCLVGFCSAQPGRALTPQVTFYPGPTNSVVVEKANRRLVFYGDPGGRIDQADVVLSTHARRDVAESARSLVEQGARFVVPAQEANHYAEVQSFWAAFTQGRFHDYAQQSTRLLTHPLRIDRAVSEGDTIAWQGLAVRVVDTPGTTRGAVTYVMELDGITLGFSGDLIFGEGQLLDLYSLQDAIPEVQIRGYHGYAGRLGILIESLEKLKGLHLDVLIPAHGPVLHDPDRAVDLLIDRVRRVYRNYLSVNAGHWYFKDRYGVMARRVLGSNPAVPWMSYANTICPDPPAWVLPIQNSRLILSTSGMGFLVDCGSRGIVERLEALRRQKELRGLEGVFITHYHDDHTDFITELVDRFACPVYATGVLTDILKHPAAYRLPAMTSKPIPSLKTVAHGHRMRWQEFDFTFYDFPGQTIYHDALLAEKQGGARILFAGDSFTPSGMDDYCMLNRNLLHPEQGYFNCLQQLRAVARPYLIINQHVREPFCFSAEQIDLMESALRQRVELLADLFPWDDCNIGIDEQWARPYPYGQQVHPGQTVDVALYILNHAAVARRYTIDIRPPAGWTSHLSERAVLTVPPHVERAVSFQLPVPEHLSPGVHMVTFDIRFGPWTLPHHCEAMIVIEEPEKAIELPIHSPTRIQVQP